MINGIGKGISKLMIASCFLLSTMVAQNCSTIENCIECDSLQNCTSCAIHYHIDQIDGKNVCNSNRENCSIYLESESKCILCKWNYETAGIHFCHPKERPFSFLVYCLLFAVSCGTCMFFVILILKNGEETPQAVSLIKQYWSKKNKKVKKTTENNTQMIGFEMFQNSKQRKESSKSIQMAKIRIHEVNAKPEARSQIQVNNGQRKSLKGSQRFISADLQKRRRGAVFN